MDNLKRYFQNMYILKHLKVCFSEQNIFVFNWFNDSLKISFNVNQSHMEDYAHLMETGFQKQKFNTKGVLIKTQVNLKQNPITTQF